MTSLTIEGKAEAFGRCKFSCENSWIFTYSDGSVKWGHVVEELSVKADAEGNWKVESGVLNNRDFEYKVEASSVDEAGNKYSEPQATTFYMPLEPITVAQQTTCNIRI